MWLTTLGAFIGALLSLVISIIIENQRKPKLFFIIEDPPIDISYINAPAKKARFLRIQLWNKEMPRIFRWISRESAMHCNADIQILHFEDLAPVFSNKVSARWAGADEPITPQIHPTTGEIIPLFDISKYNAAFRRNCYPGSKETIDIVARFDSDEDCYIWNNDSYLKGWRNDDHKLPKGRYYIIVSVFSSGEKTIGYFKLENSVGKKDFRLTSLSEDEKSKISKIQ